MNRLLKKIIAGDDFRKSRLHDEKGNMVPIGRLFRNAPRSLVTGVGRIIFGIGPKTPWISYDAIEIIGDYLQSRAACVLELGSGMSTIWFARHSALVWCVEDDEAWYGIVSRMVSGQPNVQCKYAATREQYLAQVSNYAPVADFVLVDGSYRAECIEITAELLKRGSVIYLDNSDKDALGGPMRHAENLLLDLASRRNATVTYFTDFAPTQFTPNQGMMVRL